MLNNKDLFIVNKVFSPMLRKTIFDLPQGVFIWTRLLERSAVYANNAILCLIKFTFVREAYIDYVILIFLCINSRGIYCAF